MQIYRTNWTLVFVVAVCGTTIVMTGCSSSRLSKLPTPSLSLSKLPGMKWLQSDDKKTPESSLASDAPPLPSVSTSPVPPSSTDPTSPTTAVASSTGPTATTPYPTTLAPNIPYPAQNSGVYNTGPYNTDSGIANHNGQQNWNSNSAPQSAPQSGFYPTHPTTTTGRQGELLTADARSLNNYESRARTPDPYGSSTQPNSINPVNSYPPVRNQNPYATQNMPVPTVNAGNRYTAPTAPLGNNTSSPVGTYNDRYNTTTGTPGGVIPAGNRYGQITPASGFPTNGRQVAPVAGSTYGETPPPASQNNVYGTKPAVGPTTTAPVHWRPGSTTDYQPANGVGSIPSYSTIPSNAAGVIPANHASPPLSR